MSSRSNKTRHRSTIAVAATACPVLAGTVSAIRGFSSTPAHHRDVGVPDREVMGRPEQVKADAGVPTSCRVAMYVLTIHPGVADTAVACRKVEPLTSSEFDTGIFETQVFRAIDM